MELSDLKDLQSMQVMDAEGETTEVIRCTATECPNFGKNVTLEMCGELDWHQPASRGFGDTVAKFTRVVGIRPCGGCKQRQQLLNELFPYKQEASA